MKSIVAAFLWDGSNSKSISYMMIDDNFTIRCNPEIKAHDTIGKNSFERSAKKTIDAFFNQIEEVQRTDKCRKIKIEYKIVGHANPVSPYHTKLHKPSDQTEFVRSEFLRCYTQLNENGSVELARQYRKKLKKPELDEFKREIAGLELVDGKKGNAFQFHLWSLALHATKGNFKAKISKLKKALTQPQQGVQKDKRKTRAA